MKITPPHKHGQAKNCRRESIGLRHLQVSMGVACLSAVFLAWGCGGTVEDPQRRRDPRIGPDGTLSNSDTTLQPTPAVGDMAGQPTPAPSAAPSAAPANKPPSVESVTITPRTVRVGEKIFVSVTAKDPERAPLKALVFKTEPGLVPETALDPLSPVKSITIPAEAAVTQSTTVTAIVVATDAAEQTSREYKVTFTVEPKPVDKVSECLTPNSTTSTTTAVGSVACLILK